MGDSSRPRPRRHSRIFTAGLLVALGSGIVPPTVQAQDRPADASDAEPGPQRSGFAAVLDVPFIPQSELLCGGAAATMVLRYWGATGVFPRDFQSLVRPEEGGIRTGDLVREVRRRGWRALPFRGDERELRGHISGGRPVIALIEVGPGRYHFVVVVSWTDDAVTYHDPADAPFRTVPPREFREAWDPTNRWSLLVLPASDAAGMPPDSAAGPAPPVGSPSAGADPDADGGESSGLPDVCAPAVEKAVARARAGDVARAREMLRKVVARCPASARARAELAGLRAGREDWEEAARLSEGAVELDPSLAYAWRILATSRYLLGDRVGALAAWNRVGEPRIERIRLQGLDGTRYREVQRRAGLTLDRLLTPEGFRLASRRLSLLPSARETGLRYRPRDDGRAEVVGTVLQRPVFPTSVPAWGTIAARGALSRRVTVSSASPFGGGELWTLEGRWEENRPALFLELEMPDVPLLPGVASFRGGWERETYGVVLDGADRRVREERRMARISATDWGTGRLRWELTTGLDRWVGEVEPAVELPIPDAASLDAVLEAGLEVRTLDDKMSLFLQGGGGTLLSGAPDRDYLDGGIRVRWRSSTRREGMVAHVRARARAVTDEAPLATWPGAGGGRARDGLLRSHELLEDGVISGEAFGRTLVDGGVEGRWWTSWVPGASLAVAGFVDAARPWRTLGGGEGGGDGRFLTGAGIGLRVAVPGRSGAGRADFARDLRDGGWRFQVGWEAPWPGF